MRGEADLRLRIRPPLCFRQNYADGVVSKRVL